MKRLFFAIPQYYDVPEGFWIRESSLIVRALREMGYEAFLVPFHPSDGRPADQTLPVVACTMEQMTDPAWWRSLQPDAIVLNLWSAPRHDNIRKAALQATPRVIERLDTSGVRVPRIWPRYYFVEAWGAARDVGKNPAVAWVVALLRTLATWAVPSLLERPMALTMAQLPYVVAESPLAAARIRRHIAWHASGSVQVAQISNPVYTKTMFFAPGDVKENLMIATGRWNAYQKDFPLLLSTAVAFLQEHPDWSFDIVGLGVDAGLIARAPSDVAPRIRVHGKLPQDKVAEMNRRSKIHFTASRFEGFASAPVEALCCGCSYVGPSNLAASSYLAEFESGTVAPRRCQTDLLDSLHAEAEAWKTGRRDPAAISEKWIGQSGYKQVAQRTLDLLETIPDRLGAARFADDDKRAAAVGATGIPQA